MTHSGSKKRMNPLSRLYRSLLTEFKRVQTGYAAIAIIAQSCIGSVAAMMLLMNDLPTRTKMVLLFLEIIFCMSYNAAVLAQLKARFIFNLLIISVVFSSGVIIANLI
tara:strand:- start:16753 stop:17076 length:324 start_codon:yes stop_codon:yes gene_type:complete